MEALAIVSLLAFWAASILVGLRLVRLWTRTGELPEFLIGSAFLAGGIVGAGCSLLLRLEVAPEAVAPALALVGRLARAWAAGAMVIFSWRVFRPHAPWARALALSGLAAIGLWIAGEAALLRPANDVAHPLFWAWMLVLFFAYSWMSVESLLYHGKLRRRLSLGLADAVVTNRLLLWGLAAGAIGVQAPILSVSAWMNASAGTDPRIRLVTSVLALACAVAIFLAFFPPASYRAWIEHRAAAGWRAGIRPAEAGEQ